MPDLWIFAYGSLLWDPGFVPAEARPATLMGWQRSFCMWSVHYRGSASAPGLVLALDESPGAACVGLALRPDPDEAPAVAARIRARELISDAYLERVLPVRLEGGTTVPATTYVINRASPQYCPPGAADPALVIARAAGVRGPNRDYLFNTAAQLSRLGLADPALEALADQVRRLTD
jgi:cation transport protein ChaC